MKTWNSIPRLTKRAKEGGIVVPVILWWLGVPLTLVVLLWLLF